MSENPPRDRYARSRELCERSQRVLAGGVSSEFRRFSHPHPLFYREARGSRITDVDGNEYIDFTLAQGPAILGHAHPEVLAAVAEASEAGQIYAGQHLAELELAERLQQCIPCAERVRFSLSGSESVHAALRTARAATGRPRFVRFEGHYHGWFDNVAVSISASSVDELGPRNAPVPVPWTQGLPKRVLDESIVLPWNDGRLLQATIEARHEEIAAVITEPIMCNNGCIEPEAGYLEGMRALCDRFGIALIFDEVITGFRLGLGGAQQRFGVVPDLAVFGKALANGYPISVLAGRESFMRPIAEGRAIHAGTMNAGVPSVAAALATLEILQRDRVPERIAQLGKRLMDGLGSVAAESGRTLCLQGPGPMFHTAFTEKPIREYRDLFPCDRATWSRFVAQMHDRGIRLIGRGLWYVSAAHTEQEIDHTISTAREVLRTL